MHHNEIKEYKKSWVADHTVNMLKSNKNLQLDEEANPEITGHLRI